MPQPQSVGSGQRVAITPDDMVWYTNTGGYLGRLDPKTGQFKEWLSPSGTNSRPYGIATVGDIVWYSERSYPHTVVRFDPKTEKFQTWAIPSGGGPVRNIKTDSHGNLWLAVGGTNSIARVEVRKSY